MYAYFVVHRVPIDCLATWNARFVPSDRAIWLQTRACRCRTRAIVHLK